MSYEDRPGRTAVMTSRRHAHTLRAWSTNCGCNKARVVALATSGVGVSRSCRARDIVGSRPPPLPREYSEKKMATQGLAAGRTTATPTIRVCSPGSTRSGVPSFSRASTHNHP